MSKAIKELEKKKREELMRKYYAPPITPPYAPPRMPPTKSSSNPELEPWKARREKAKKEIRNFANEMRVKHQLLLVNIYSILGELSDEFAELSKRVER